MADEDTCVSVGSRLHFALQVYSYKYINARSLLFLSNANNVEIRETRASERLSSVTETGIILLSLDYPKDTIIARNKIINLLRRNVSYDNARDGNASLSIAKCYRDFKKSAGREKIESASSLFDSLRSQTPYEHPRVKILSKRYEIISRWMENPIHFSFESSSARLYCRHFAKAYEVLRTQSREGTSVREDRCVRLFARVCVCKKQREEVRGCLFAVGILTVGDVPLSPPTPN